jgi:hypothetical protein
MEYVLYLSLPLNQSFQIGDIAYWVKTTTAQGFITQDTASSTPVTEIGVVKSITYEDSDGDGTNDVAIVVTEISDQTEPPEVGVFILFSKDRVVNETSILGYYADFKWVNDSRDRAELFMVGTEVVPNS